MVVCCLVLICVGLCCSRSCVVLLLFVVCRSSLLVVRCSLLVVGCSVLFDVCCRGVRCMVLGGSSSLLVFFKKNCLMCVVWCLLFVGRWPLFGVYGLSFVVCLFMCCLCCLFDYCVLIVVCYCLLFVVSWCVLFVIVCLLFLADGSLYLVVCFWFLAC